jgi:hypothetical protein
MAFVVQGPVDPRRGPFVGRGGELTRLEDWLGAVRCVGAVLGARQTGKTSLLLRSREILDDRSHMVFVNLEAIQGASPGDCFAFIAAETGEQLGLGSPGEAAPRDGAAFLRFLRGLAGAVRRPRVGVLLDEVGALPPETGQRLAHTLRAAFTNRHVQAELERYVFVVAGSTDLLELTSGRNSPLKNVTESIYLADLGPEEARTLLQEGFGAAGVPLTEAVAGAILDWAGGHPYWTQLLGREAAGRGLTGADEVGRLAAELLETEDRSLPHLRQAIALLPETAAAAMRRILRGKDVPFRRSDPAVVRLELAGLVRAASGQCVLRNRIFEAALQRLDPSPGPAPTRAPPQRGSVSVFVSYAHADETLRRELGKHLSVLERQGLISTWHDRMIPAGEEWGGAIDRRLDEAQVILLLVSADFVQSHYCYDVEMRRAIERHEGREALVVPVILRPVVTSGLPFSKIQTLPRNARAVTDWPTLDAAFVDVTEGLRAAIESLRPPAPPARHI